MYNVFRLHMRESIIIIMISLLLVVNIGNQAEHIVSDPQPDIQIVSNPGNCC